MNRFYPDPAEDTEWVEPLKISPPPLNSHDRIFEEMHYNNNNLTAGNNGMPHLLIELLVGTTDRWFNCRRANLETPQRPLPAQDCGRVGPLPPLRDQGLRPQDDPRVGPRFGLRHARFTRNYLNSIKFFLYYFNLFNRLWPTCTRTTRNANATTPNWRGASTRAPCEEIQIPTSPCPCATEWWVVSFFSVCLFVFSISFFDLVDVSN